MVNKVLLSVFIAILALECLIDPTYAVPIVQTEPSGCVDIDTGELVPFDTAGKGVCGCNAPPTVTGCTASFLGVVDSQGNPSQCEHTDSATGGCKARTCKYFVNCPGTSDDYNAEKPCTEIKTDATSPGSAGELR